MSPAHLSRLWLITGTVTLYFAVNSWLVTQGAAPILDINLLVERPVPAAVIGLPIVAVLLGLQCALGLRYVEVAPGAHWAARLPVVGLTDLDTRSREGRIYQGAFLLGFILIPTASLVHFWRKIAAAKVIGAKQDMLFAPLDIGALAEVHACRACDAPYRIATHATEAAAMREAGVEWYPVAEPVVFACLSLLAFVQVYRLLRRVFGTGPRTE
jgi:hypothetical protein